MFALKERDKKYLLEHVPNIEAVIATNDKASIQFAFYDWMDSNCWHTDGELIQPIADEAQEIWNSIRETD